MDKMTGYIGSALKYLEKNKKEKKKRIDEANVENF